MTLQPPGPLGIGYLVPNKSTVGGILNIKSSTHDCLSSWLRHLHNQSDPGILTFDFNHHLPHLDNHVYPLVPLTIKHLAANGTLVFWWESKVHHHCDINCHRNDCFASWQKTKTNGNHRRISEPPALQQTLCLLLHLVLHNLQQPPLFPSVNSHLLLSTKQSAFHRPWHPNRFTKQKSIVLTSVPPFHCLLEECPTPPVSSIKRRTHHQIAVDRPLAAITNLPANGILDPPHWSVDTERKWQQKDTIEVMASPNTTPWASENTNIHLLSVALFPQFCEGKLQD